jgi:hypothetical protein
MGTSPLRHAELNAASIAAMSIFFICIIAARARDAAAVSASLANRGRISGTICHDTPNLSLSQPHMLSLPPSASRADHRPVGLRLIFRQHADRGGGRVLEHVSGGQDHHRRTGKGELDDHGIVRAAVIDHGVDPAVRQEADVELRRVDPAPREPQAGAHLAMFRHRGASSLAAFAPA